jgi:hypothetical protein
VRAGTAGSCKRRDDDRKPRETTRLPSGVLKRADFPNHLANLQEPAGVEFGMSALHGFHMFGMSAPGFERFL